jgi:hypothetical protein
MTGKPLPLGIFLATLAGPIIWFAHFAGLYLAEALLCVHPRPGVTDSLRMIGALWTVPALATLLALVIRDRKAADRRQGGNTIVAEAHSRLKRPLITLSILAVLWTSGPLFVLPACTPGG